MRSELRSFVPAKAQGARPPQELTDQAPLLADGWPRSVHRPELLLLMDRSGPVSAQPTVSSQNTVSAQNTVP